MAAAVVVCVSAEGAPEYPFQRVNGAIVAQALDLSKCSQTVLELYGTGMDAVSAKDLQVAPGGKSATVLFAGPQGAFPGLDQINVVIPSSLAGSGKVAINLTARGQTANPVNVTIQ